MKHIVFSIATVTYNAEACIKTTLDSILAQTYPHKEFLLIDGASEDRTLDLVRDRQADLERCCEGGIILRSEPDKGLYDAMNKAIRTATGHYLIFLNAGDRFHAPDTLAQVAAALSKRESAWPDILYGQTDIVDAAGNYLRPRHYLAPEHLTARSFLQGMLVCHQAFWPSLALIRHNRPAATDSAAETGAEGNAPVEYDLRYRYSADYDWCIRLLRQSRENFYTRLTLIDYLDEGLTTRNHRASLRERFRVMAAHYGLPATLLSHLRILLRKL